MHSSSTADFYTRTFLHIYEQTISPKLEEIDLFFKINQEDLTIQRTAKLLCINQQEVIDLMKKNGICQLNRATFFIIMSQASSYICGFFQRELERGIPKVYSVDDISYIYQLHPKKVQAALNLSDIKEITSDNIKILFSYIPIQMING